MASTHDHKTTPRNYQQTLFLKATEENIIAFLPTGTGKTLISTLLIKHYAIQDTKKNIIFLAPTVPLVNQQAEYIKEQTNLSAEPYSGDEAKDVWRDPSDLKEDRVLVMTPIIFYHCLITASLFLEDISLLVMDECHHCTKRHPYNLIFIDFYFPLDKNKRPRVFGMTASPVPIALPTVMKSLGKCDLCEVHYTDELQKAQHLAGVKHRRRLKAADIYGLENLPSPKKKNKPALKKTPELIINSSINSLERNMNCRLISADSDEVSKHVLNPLEEHIHYNLLDDPITQEIQNFIDELIPDEPPSTKGFINIPCPSKDRLIFVLQELGTISLYIYLKLFLDNIYEGSYIPPKYIELMDYLVNNIQNSKFGDTHLLGPKVYSLFEALDQFFDSKDLNPLCEDEEINNDDLKDNQEKRDDDFDINEEEEEEEDNIEEKRILEETKQEDPNVKCDVNGKRLILFISEKRVALVIHELLSKQEFILEIENKKETKQFSSYFKRTARKSKTLFGGTRMKSSQKLIKSFVNNEFNVLIATSVAEEGLDIKTCGLVVCFDTQNITSKAYIQRKGRARKANSSFLFFASKEHLKTMKEHEKRIVKIANERLQDDLIEKNPIQYLEYLVTDAGAKITENSAEEMLKFYLQQLPRDFYWEPRAIFKTVQVVRSNINYFVSKCILPVNCPLKQKSYEGREYLKKRHAENSAALAACRALYEKGILDERLLPHEELEAIQNIKIYSKPTFLVTRSTPPIAEYWKTIEHNFDTPTITLYDNRITFTSENEEDCDYFKNEIRFLSKMKFNEPIHISKGTKLSISIINIGSIELSKDEFMEKVNYHRKLAVLKEKISALSDIKPLESGSEYLYLAYFPNISYKQLEELIEKPIEYYNDAEKLKQEVTGRIIVLQYDKRKFLWYVEGVDTSSNPSSMMDGNIDFKTYYATKLGISVDKIDNNQPLLRITKLVRTKNYELSKLNNYWKRGRILSAIPQFSSLYCLSAVDVQSSQILSTSLWQANHTLLVREFKERYEMETGEPISIDKMDMNIITKLLRSCDCSIEGRTNEEISILLLQLAFTARSASLKFNYELLETLGDSFLKFVVTQFLYESHPDNHEGILTGMRAKLVSNTNLDYLGKEKSLQKYIISKYLAVLSRNNEEIEHPAKRIADVVEALIAVFLLLGGIESALKFLLWIGIPIYKGNTTNTISNTKSLRKPVDISLLEKDLNYKFKDWRFANTARIHASCRNTSECFQRLEFLGDAVLDFLVSKFFFAKYCEDLNPHLLSALRSEVVCNSNFAEAATLHNLDNYILYNVSIFKDQIREYKKFVKRIAFLNNEEKFYESILNPAPKIIADVLESLAAAVFLDSGNSLDITWSVFENILKKQLNGINPSTLNEHPVVQLHRLQDKTIKIYRDVEIERVKGILLFTSLYYAEPQSEKIEGEKELLDKAEATTKSLSSTNAAIKIIDKLFSVVINALFY